MQAGEMEEQNQASVYRKKAVYRLHFAPVLFFICGGTKSHQKLSALERKKEFKPTN